MTVSSNFFGNIFLSFLPVFLAISSYGTSSSGCPQSGLWFVLYCLPFDNVDNEFLKKPHIWSASSITRFMAWSGQSHLLLMFWPIWCFTLISCPCDHRRQLSSWYWQWPLITLSKRAGLLSLCGPRPWSSTCYAHSNCLFVQSRPACLSLWRPWRQRFLSLPCHIASLRQFWRQPAEWYLFWLFLIIVIWLV